MNPHGASYVDMSADDWYRAMVVDRHRRALSEYLAHQGKYGEHAPILRGGHVQPVSMLIASSVALIMELS